MWEVINKDFSWEIIDNTTGKLIIKCNEFVNKAKSICENHNREINVMPVSIKIKNYGDYKIESIKVGDWIDLAVSEDIEMKQGESKKLPLGVAIQLPEGYEAHVVPRSSTFDRYKIIQTNSIGIIDNSYCGDDDIWMFPAFAMSDTKIPKGTRICQFRIMETMKKACCDIEIEYVDSLGNANRGGFGSTGK